MQYPQSLVAKIKAKTADLPLEGFLSGQGPIHPKLMIVGEAPGRTEITSKIPFSGRSGDELLNGLNSIGLNRDDVYITSVVRSRPYSHKISRDKNGNTIEKFPNRTPSKKEVKLFAPLFDWELRQVKPHLIATVGNTSLQRLLGRTYQIGDVHGQVFQQPIQIFDEKNDAYQRSKESYLIVPLFHPAAIFYNRSLTPLIKQDWQTVGNLVSP